MEPSIRTGDHDVTEERAIELAELSDDEVELVAGGAGVTIDPNGKP